MNPEKRTRWGGGGRGELENTHKYGKMTNMSLREEGSNKRWYAFSQMTYTTRPVKNYYHMF